MHLVLYCSQPVFALRNPDCTADHHPHWRDPPDSYTAECSTVTGRECPSWFSPLYLLLSSQGDQSPDDGGSRLLTAHCHPNCPNSGSNCSACSGKQNFYRIQLNVTRKTIWFRKLLIFPISSWSKTKYIFRLVRRFSCKEASRCEKYNSCITLFFRCFLKVITINRFYQKCFRCTSSSRTDSTLRHPIFPPPPHSMYKYQEQ